MTIPQYKELIDPTAYICDHNVRCENWDYTPGGLQLLRIHQQLDLAVLGIFRS